MTDRDRLAELVASALENDEPTEWFDRVYAAGRDGHLDVPWAAREPNPNLVEWLDREEPPTGEALVVGCGLGDDAEALADRGHDVTAFDISPTAVDWCRDRFPDSGVAYRVADLFDAPDDWQGRFDLVVEISTLQALPEPERREARTRIAEFVAPDGTLLVVCRGRDPDEAATGPPWPLTEAETRAFEEEGLETVAFEDYGDDETPPVRRFRIEFVRPT